MTDIVATKSFLVSNLSLPFDAEDSEFLDFAAKKMKRIGTKPDMLHFQIYKKSIDARKKENI